MVKTFYLMRHGQTLFNQRGKIQGWCDSPLTPLGIAQAQRTAPFFDDIALDHLYSSTSERACDTLELATRSKLPYIRLKGLKEVNFGIFEGENEDLHAPAEMRPTYYQQFGGEHYSDVRNRVVATCTDIMEKDDHQCVLAVSHSGSCRHFLREWAGDAEILKSEIPNCCIFKYQYENGVFRFEETFHFPV